MSKILAVFGATGQQGSSVVDYVLNDAELSQMFKIRAITRDVNSDKAKQLKEKVEVVQGDFLDRNSLEKALHDVHTVFAMTTPFGPGGFANEYENGKTIADVAVSQGASYIIFSTLPPVNEISGGKYTHVTPFDAKAKIEQYIRSLNIKSAFYSPGSFMENFQVQAFLAPREGPDGTWVMARHTSPQTQMPLIDAVGDTGKFVGAILAEPDKYQGKTFCAAQALYSMKEVVTIMSRATGKTVVYKQVPLEEFRESLSFLGPLCDIFVEAFSYGEEYGYYGPETEKLIYWAAENARGKLANLEEFFERHPLQLA